VLGFTAYHVLSGSVVAMAGATSFLPGQLADRIMRQVMQLALTLLGAQFVIAGADMWWVRHKHAKEMRMSKEDIRQEAKESDGNPHVKARLRQIRMSRARKRMMTAVPTATVVVTNPTHYAIALLYDREKGGAPRVVAKGVDEVAARIRELASEHRVPLVPNPPLARALYKVELDAEIPAEHFKMVAEVIAYVWRLRGRAAR
jgi:flagellar biosynthetic protein FlhB